MVEGFTTPLVLKARSFLRNLFLSRRVDVDLDQEVHSYLALLIEENIRAGMLPREAQRAARIELGGVKQVTEQVRDSRTGAFLDSCKKMVRPGGLELPTFWFVARRSIQLSYGRAV